MVTPAKHMAMSDTYVTVTAMWLSRGLLYRTTHSIYSVKAMLLADNSLLASQAKLLYNTITFIDFEQILQVI